ncbi:MAG: threonine synthase [Thermoplasmatota archaeon]
MQYVPSDREPFRWAPTGRGVWRYRTLLPSVRGDPVTLGEGGTPLVALPRLAAWAGLQSLFGKVEGMNPTGSFKDRGMTVAVSLARDAGASLLLCASTGNTSAALAAYAARAKIPCAVLVPKGRVARGKLSQAIALGARVLEVEGTFDEALKSAEELAHEEGRILMNSVNPFRLEGQKTIPLEIMEEMPSVPDIIAFPYGNGGNVSAAWKGLREAQALGGIRRVPRLFACEAEDRPETFASAIRIGRAVNERKAETAIRDSKGLRIAVSDAEIAEAQRALAQEEGVLVEPASAAGLAGLRKARAERILDGTETAVVILTGTGLKDPDAALRLGSASITVGADVASLRRVLGGSASHESLSTRGARADSSAPPRAGASWPASLGRPEPGLRERSEPTGERGRNVR